MESMEIENEGNENTPGIKENGLHLRPVAPEEFGEGLPYAPVDWPNPGDTWTWRVGRRVAITGHYLDRYLYPPKRLRNLKKSIHNKKGFASKLSVERFIRLAFPDADIDAFFASFSWKIPSKKSSITSNLQRRVFFPVPSEEAAEDSISDSQSDGMACKVGNKKCSSLVAQAENQPSMPCDICCSEANFCRDCCCILCCKTINLKHGGYSYIKCKAVVSEGQICGHIGHIDCARRIYLAGTVGGSIGLDTEYYCRRCDVRTDLVPHVMKLLQTCQSIDSRDQIEKILQVGVSIIGNTSRTDAKVLRSRIELAIKKLNCGTVLEDIWKVEDEVSADTTGASLNENDMVEVTNHQELMDNGTTSPEVVAMASDCQTEALKLEEEIDQVLQELQASQEYEYKLAEEQLSAQKSYLKNLYLQLDKDKSTLAHHTLNTDPDALLSAILSRVDQIKQEMTKLNEMKKVAEGFGKTPKSVLKEHFGLEVDED